MTGLYPHQAGVGHMTADRWRQLIDQLKELGDVANPPKPEDCFWTAQ